MLRSTCYWNPEGAGAISSDSAFKSWQKTPEWNFHSMLPWGQWGDRPLAVGNGSHHCQSLQKPSQNWELLGITSSFPGPSTPCRFASLSFLPIPFHCASLAPGLSPTPRHRPDKRIECLNPTFCECPIPQKPNSTGELPSFWGKAQSTHICSRQRKNYQGVLDFPIKWEHLFL